MKYVKLKTLILIYHYGGKEMGEGAVHLRKRTKNNVSCFVDPFRVALGLLSEIKRSSVQAAALAFLTPSGNCLHYAHHDVERFSNVGLSCPLGVVHSKFREHWTVRELYHGKGIIAWW